LVRGDQEADVLGNPEPHPSVRRPRTLLTEEQREFLRAQPFQRLVSSFTLVHSSLDDPSHWKSVLSQLEAESSFKFQAADLCFFWTYPRPARFYPRFQGPRVSLQELDLKPEKKYFVNVGSVR
jgi:hypothetical protein